MRTKEFLGRLDHEKIVDAIRQAESKTSAEIRVFLQRGKLGGDALVAAREQFQRFGMHKTHARNAALIFVAPRARKFAIVGDHAIHENFGQEGWNDIAAAMATDFQLGKFTEAILTGIEQIGQGLARHFPKTDSNPNELPDDVIES